MLVRQVRHTPEGHPDIVYAGGSYSYGETDIANKRGVVLSTDAGVTGTDMTIDGTDPVHPNGLHPDQHALVTNPNNPIQFFEANDGGVMRSSGDVRRPLGVVRRPRGLTGDARWRAASRCSRGSRRSSRAMNKGLPTLQFQSLSVSPLNPQLLQGGRRTTAPGRPRATRSSGRTR